MTIREARWWPFKLVTVGMVLTFSTYLIVLFTQADSAFWIALTTLGVSFALGAVSGWRRSKVVDVVLLLGMFAFPSLGATKEARQMAFLAWIVGTLSGMAAGAIARGRRRPENVEDPPPFCLYYGIEPERRLVHLDRNRLEEIVFELGSDKQSPWGLTMSFPGRRMDVFGSRDSLMVYVNLSHEDERAWHHLCTPGAGNTDRSVDFGGLVGTFQEFQVVNADAAVTAARYFLDHKDLHPALEWRTSPHVWDMRPPGID